jgi:hypothetical protein
VLLFVKLKNKILLSSFSPNKFVLLSSLS